MKKYFQNLFAGMTFLIAGGAIVQRAYAITHWDFHNVFGMTVVTITVVGFLLFYISDRIEAHLLQATVKILEKHNTRLIEEKMNLLKEKSGEG